MVFFLHANAKVASRCRHAANKAFDLFNIILYVITRKVRKCPLSPVVTSNVVLSGLVRLADILARLVQMADSLSALQLTGALFTINWGTLCQTHLPPIHPYPYPQPPSPTFWTAPPPLLLFSFFEWEHRPILGFIAGLMCFQLPFMQGICKVVWRVDLGHLRNHFLRCPILHLNPHHHLQVQQQTFFP